MTRVCLVAADRCPWGGGYSSPATGQWAPGEERELEDDLAEHLLDTFPGAFLSVEAVQALSEPPPPAPPTPAEVGLVAFSPKRPDRDKPKPAKPPKKK